jgi:hypothetical protein
MIPGANSIRALALTFTLTATVALAGCGTASNSRVQIHSKATPPGPARISSAPPGASTQSCPSRVPSARELRLAGTGCSAGRLIVLGWTMQPRCGVRVAASRSSCTVAGYRCQATSTDAGIAVSCSRQGAALSFLSKRRKS